MSQDTIPSRRNKYISTKDQCLGELIYTHKLHDVKRQLIEPKAKSDIWSRKSRRFVKLNHEIEIQHHPKAERKHVQFKEEEGRRRSERIKKKELKKT